MGAGGSVASADGRRGWRPLGRGRRTSARTARARGGSRARFSEVVAEPPDSEFIRASADLRGTGVASHPAKSLVIARRQAKSVVRVVISRFATKTLAIFRRRPTLCYCFVDFVERSSPRLLEDNEVAISELEQVFMIATVREDAANVLRPMQGANASRKEIKARVGKRQWLAVLSKIADCARASVLVKRLGSQSAGNVAGVREALVACANDDKGVSQGDLAETNNSVSQVNLPEITPLMRACKEGDEPCVLALLEAGVDVDEASPGSCCTALHYAALSGDEACVRALIKEGANVNHPCSGGFTALFMACGNEYDQIVTALLDANADPLRVGGHAGLGFGLGFALGLGLGLALGLGFRFGLGFR